METRLLDFDRIASRWQGETSNLVIWMNDATFHRYVEAYLETSGIQEPTLQQSSDAVTFCRRLECWVGCKDSDVHIRRIGKHS